MTVVRWSPVQQLAAVEIDRLHRMFGDVFGEGRRSIPPVDIYETDTHDVVIKAELPGMTREAIHVTVEDQILTITGARTRGEEIRPDRLHRRERAEGEFSRSFTLPATLDPTRIAASYDDGVLTLTVPQREEAKPRQISIT